MSPTSCGPGPPGCGGGGGGGGRTRRTLVALTLMMLSSMMGSSVRAEKSRTYHMQSLCKTHFLQTQYRKTEGAVLWSQNERNLDCIITFQTHSILQRFMLRFDMLQLDCNDHLYVYDGAHAVGAHKSDLSCRNTKQQVGAIFTRTNFVTLKYVTDGWGTDTNGFKLVITAVKDPKHACLHFRCNSREFCIDSDLVCDGINHCGDGSDEVTSTICQNQDTNTVLGMELSWFVLVAVSSVLVVSACIVSIAICVCRRSTRAQGNALQTHQTVDSNGFSKHQQQQQMQQQHQQYTNHHHNNHIAANNHHNHGGGTLPRETTLPASGNLHRPAGPSGYRRITRRLLMAKVRPTWCQAN